MKGIFEKRLKSHNKGRWVFLMIFLSEFHIDKDPESVSGPHWDGFIETGLRIDLHQSASLIMGVF